MTEPQRIIAVLIDGDNASPASIEKVLKQVGKLGVLLIRRAYGDWGAINMSGWKDIERTCSVQLIQQSRYIAGKNATDMAMLIDAMDILYSGKVNTFCLVSSDSDFTPLAIRLRDEGCEVIGVGNKDTNEAFINACTQFITTVSLTDEPKKKPVAKLPTAKLPKAALAPVPPKVAKTSKTAKTVKITQVAKVAQAPKMPSPVSRLKEAFQAAPHEDGWVFLGMLGHTLHQLDAGFKPNKYGHSTLSKLIRAYPNLFEVKGDGTKMYVRLKAT